MPQRHTPARHAGRAIGLALSAGLLLAGRPAATNPLTETFDGPKLDAKRWAITHQADFQERAEDIVDGRLHLRAATIGTRDETVKFHGIRTRQPLSLAKGLDLSFDLDWNQQANGCYMTAGIFLCPDATDANPAESKQWLKLEYIGVPPGRNARALVAIRGPVGERHLFTEGWPEKQRTGRAIGKQHVRLLWTGKHLKVWENGKLLFEGDSQLDAPPKAYLYLQMSSHSNYPAREVFFDNVTAK